MILIAFRFDDPSVNSDHYLEKEIINICEKYNIKLNFAVIPYKKINDTLVPISKESVAHLVQAEKKESIEISQHGYMHVSNSGNNKKPSEFSGMPFSDQQRMISEGKKLLDSIFTKSPKGFVPPWNTFDSTTLRVLDEMNFKFISADWDIPSEHNNFNINIIPRTCQTTQVKTIVKKSLKFSLFSPIIIPVLHHYDFHESGSKLSRISLEEFEKTINYLKREGSVNITSLNLLSEKLNSRQCRSAFKIHRTITNLHWRLQNFLPSGLFITINPIVD